ncbi:hypothetical protein [Aeromonas veronii]|uniref:hypothetical protein n=1 Tax=Aeromonas TaxID=642 RepID=UPI002255EA8F|nr:hypothetical protein [Aeromonas veronii]MCX4045287.1 hypothetical protein [Aeromonas veronii]HDN9006236.1 hypothetical protein [Aeromonas veronii]
MDFIFSDGDKRAQLLVVGHVLLVFFVGAGFLLIGTNIVLADTCEIVTFSRRTGGLLWKFANYIQLIGYCQELVGIAVFGIIISYSNARLFWGWCFHVNHLKNKDVVINHKPI